MRKQLPLIVACIVVFVGACASEAFTPNDVQQVVDAKGAKAAIDSLYGTPEWDALISGIASGDSDWLKVADAIVPGSDAGSASELKDAVAWALPHAPDEVLRMVKDDSPWENTCLGPPVDFPKEGPNQYFSNSIAALERMSSNAMQGAKQACLEQLRYAAIQAEQRQ